MNNNKKIIILLIFAISLFSFTTFLTYSRYVSVKKITNSIKTKELKIEFATNGSSTFVRNTGSVVNITDTHSSNYTAKYVWSTSNNTDASEGTEFNSGDEIINSTLSGTYYLCIYVEDDKGFSLNECSNAFNIDNTAPSITFTYDGNDTYKHSQSSIVTVENDIYGAELDESSLKYIWSKNVSDISIETFTSGEELTKSEGSGDYYIVAQACDSLGNCTTATSEVFKLDNDGPEATLTSSSAADMRGYISYTATDNESGIVGYNITKTATEPTEWIPVLNEVESTTEVKQEYGALWARIFHHNNRWGDTYFANATEAGTSNTLDKYSVLNDIEKYKQNGKFEFLLEYPDVSDTQYNRWIQTANPITTSAISGDGSEKVPGYEAVHIDWTGDYWSGLALSSTTTTLIDGSYSHGWWWYALGTYSAYSNAMPGPNDKLTSIANLWTRIDGLTGVNKKTLSGRLGDIKEDGTYYVWFKDDVGNVSRYETNVERNYLIKYNPNGGTFEGTTNATTKIYKYTDNVSVANPTRTGYTFTGWSTLASAKGYFADAAEYTLDNTTGTSYKELKQYTISPSFAAGEVYQLDFDAKGTGRLTTYFYGASNYLQVATVTNSDGFSGTGTDGNNSVNLTSNYKHYTVKFTLGSSGDGSVTKYVLFRLLAGNSASIKNIKFNKVDASASTFDSNITIQKNSLLYAIWLPNTYTVTCEDWFVDASNNRKVKLGSSTKTYAYGTSVSGTAWGTDGATSKYYSGYAYKSATSGTVPANNNLVVYRYFHAWTNMNIYYAGSSTENGATVSFKVGNGSWTDVTNESNTVQPYGTTYYVKNIRPKNSYEEFDKVTNLTWNSAGYYTYTPTAGGTSMNIYMKYKTYTISYNLNSGSVSGNPTSYNYSTAAFTLKNPTRSGYTFTGWSGTGLSGSANKTVTIAKGSTGNKSYTANWSANSYYLDLNGLINNKGTGGITGCGTADVYINGTLKANDVADYYTQWVTGTKYEIKDIKTTAGCTYNGVSSGSLSGTITSANVVVQLKYTFSSRSFGYTGGMQSWVAPAPGTYRLEVWGAQGGASQNRVSTSLVGGKGGYAKGNVSLTAGTTLYIGVGQQGTSNGGAAYNGGGAGGSFDGKYGGGGGGATHIGKSNATLVNTAKGNLYIVAGGGGGSGNDHSGGAGGGTNGSAGAGSTPGGGGTQSAAGGGGNAGAYGKGGNSTYQNGAGGGGLYGGGGANGYSSSSGGGGSGYVGGVTGGAMSNGSRTGSGYATITYVG